jgi:hypothetical protein
LVDLRTQISCLVSRIDVNQRKCGSLSRSDEGPTRNDRGSNAMWTCRQQRGPMIRRRKASRKPQQTRGRNDARGSIPMGLAIQGSHADKRCDVEDPAET